MGRLRRARHVQHPRNAGSPTGREPYGDGVLVVVSGGESPPHGEGGQVEGSTRVEVARMGDSAFIRRT